MTTIHESLTVQQQNAIEQFICRSGRCWKDALRECWMTGRYPSECDSASLQQIRNTLGPSWLARVKL
jgi:hypothetical protein